MDNKAEYLAQAIKCNFYMTTLALKKLNDGASSSVDDSNFQLQNEVEPDYQLMKSYTQGRIRNEQILPILRQRLPNILKLQAMVARGTPFEHDLETVARESSTIRDEDIVSALELAKPRLVQLVADLETARTH